MGLNNKRAVYNVLGGLCKDTSKLRSDIYNLNEEDFPLKVQKLVYATIYELSYDNPNLTQITAIDIDNHLSGYPEYYKIFEKSNGFQYIVNCIEASNVDLFDKYYNEVKKFSLLRTYEENGFDVKKVYNYEEMDIKEKGRQFDKLMKMTEDDIVKEITLSILEVKEKWNFSNNVEKTSFHASDNIDENLTELLDNGEIGLSFSSPYLNSIFLGGIRGKFLLRSANSGGGKTRLLIADACEFACSHKYNTQKNKWEEIGQCAPTLYICTELELQEIQIIMLAYISGVTTRKIKQGGLNKVDQEKVNIAKEIIRSSPLYVEVLEDGDITDLKMMIENHILKNGVTNVIYDYIENSPKMCRSIAKLYGISGIREDQVLQSFSNSLKQLAVKYNVFIESGTQLNREYTYDENNLAGGKACARKVDSGVIIGHVSELELDKVKGFCEQTGYTPNYAHHIYKNRGGGESRIIVFTNMNLGNMREEFCFATDYQYQLKDIAPMEIKPKTNVNKSDNDVDF